MMLVNTKYRTSQEEIMDNFGLKGKELEVTLNDLDKVNWMLGGNRVTLNGVKKMLKNVDSNTSIRIIDIGCGNGSILREIAKYGRRKGLRLDLIGLDANTHAIDIASKQSIAYPEISYKAMNVFSEPFSKLDSDIFLCTLTLHHFQDEEIIRLLEIITENATIGAVINDLHRSRLAYYLFHLFCAVFIRNKIAKEDGLVSILRSFKRSDFKRYSKRLRIEAHAISWKWAFRYQWILFNKKTLRGKQT